MGSLKLTTASSGSVILSPANTASDVTITVPASTSTMLTSTSTFYQNSGPAFSAYATSGTSMTGGVTTKISFQAEGFDTNNNFASSRFTPTVAGYYQINAAVNLSGNTSSGYGLLYIYKNGSEYKQGSSYAGGANSPNACISGLVYCNGSTDYIEIYGICEKSITTGGSSVVTWFDGVLVRAA